MKPGRPTLQRIQTYKEPVPLKYGKLATTKYPWIYGYFYSALSLTKTRCDEQKSVQQAVFVACCFTNILARHPQR